MHPATPRTQHAATRARSRQHGIKNALATLGGHIAAETSSCGLMQCIKHAFRCVLRPVLLTWRH
jgi:hypothetical protein